MPGSTKYWQGFLFSNSKYILDSVLLDGTPLNKSENNFWVHDSKLNLSAPHNLTLTTYGGATVSAVVSNVTAATNMTVQFAGWSPDGSDEPPDVFYYQPTSGSRSSRCLRLGHKHLPYSFFPILYALMLLIY